MPYKVCNGIKCKISFKNAKYNEKHGLEEAKTHEQGCHENSYKSCKYLKFIFKSLFSNKRNEGLSVLDCFM